MMPDLLRLLEEEKMMLSLHFFFFRIFEINNKKRRSMRGHSLMVIIQSLPVTPTLIPVVIGYMFIIICKKYKGYSQTYITRSLWDKQHLTNYSMAFLKKKKKKTIFKNSSMCNHENIYIFFLLSVWVVYKWFLIDGCIPNYSYVSENQEI